MEPSATLPLFKRTSSEGETAKHLLRSMHKIFSHDLPNQVLVMQTLLQMLELEESERLSADGKEQVQRLQVAARKAGGMVRFLKEMSRLPSRVPRKDVVSLDCILSDVRAELYQRCPETEVELLCRGEPAPVVADPLLLAWAIVELLGISLEGQADVQVARWEASAEWRDGEVEILFRNHSLDEAISCSTAPPGGRKMAEQRMEIVLACEWLKLAGGSLKLPADSSPCRQFALVFPGGDIAHG